jgi:hypothetical protein
MPGQAGEADKEVGLFSWRSIMLRHAHGTNQTVQWTSLCVLSTFAIELMRAWS